MQFHHLSHIDLDGYGCQLVSTEFFKDSASLYFYNANYGKEVMARISQIIANIKKSKDKDALILISDLNLTLNECEELSKEVLDLNLAGFSVKYELLDHHKSGQECADKYPWYILDTKRCATKIVYETLASRYALSDEIKAWLEPMVAMINSIDLWLENGYNFEFGKVAMRLVIEAKELNRFMFDDADRDYKLALLRESAKFLAQEKGHILLDNAVLELKKNYLNGSLMSDTLDNLASFYQVDLLEKRAEFCTIYYGKYRGFLSYSIGSISVLANLFLKQNPDFDFFMDVNFRGNVSLRANNKCDVSLLSKKCFNGGGHPNASGGKIDGFKESFLYSEIKASIEEVFLKVENE